ncbi:MAG: hypothetical protein IMW89_20340 [Ktedonobacteraceae bacterium]|nr:hypothetical protein [Ktedonobacteraceae bacterium]
MSTSKEERDRVLRMVEEGLVTAAEAGELLDALATEREAVTERLRERVIRVRATKFNARAQKTYITASIPFQIIRMGLELGISLVPQLGKSALADLVRDVERGASGRLLDLQDLEKGERLEIFVE